MSRRAAISPIGTGAEPRRASSASARTAWADFAVMTNNRRASLLFGHDGPEEDGPLGAPARAHGRDLPVLCAAKSQLRAGLDRPRGPQDRARERVRAAVFPLVARAAHTYGPARRARTGLGHRRALRNHRRIPPALRRRPALELGRRVDRRDGRRAVRAVRASRRAQYGRRVNAFPRPPIESMRPVVSFAVVRLLLAAAALLATAILGFPTGAALPIILAAVAIPWALAALFLARRDPARALTPLVAAGDLVVIAAVQASAPEIYVASHFIALLFIGAHAHFQGQRRGVLIGAAGAALLIGVTVWRPGPIHGDQLAFYETVFAVSCLATAAVIGELRGIETAGRLRARELSRRTIVGEDEVRRHVADFIHDGPVQELIGLDLMLRGAAKASERGDTARTSELIAQARAIAESNVHALRDEIVNLGPYAFEELSFEIAVERCIPVWKRRYNCTVSVDGNVD